MKVSELIELLQMENPDAEVHFSYNYGDYWRTQVAPTVDNVMTGRVVHSAYHSMDKVVDDSDDDLYDENGNYREDLTAVVLLS